MFYAIIQGYINIFFFWWRRQQRSLPAHSLLPISVIITCYIRALLFPITFISFPINIDIDRHISALYLVQLVLLLERERARAKTLLKARGRSIAKCFSYISSIYYWKSYNIGALKRDIGTSFMNFAGCTSYIYKILFFYTAPADSCGCHSWAHQHQPSLDALYRRVELL